METSIFSFLKSYTPREGRDPLEDYLTQLFAWMLKNVNKLSNEFCLYVMERIEDFNIDIDNADIEIKTQEKFGDGIADMTIEINEKVLLIFEHKVFSNFSDSQLLNYKDAIKKSNQECYLVIITANAIQHSPKADLCLIWSDIYKYIDGFMKDKDSEKMLFLLKQFNNFLEEQGLGPMHPITLNQIFSCFPAQKLESKVSEIFKRVVNLNWTYKIPQIKEISPEAYNPKYQSKKWGRIGIDFFDTWKPGIFVGILLETADHKIEPKQEKWGPDFVVFLESDYIRAPKARENFIYSQGFAELCNRLEKDSGSFEYLKPSPYPWSPWRLIILRKPLYEILKYAYNENNQVESIISNIYEGIELLTQGNLIINIWEENE